MKLIAIKLRNYRGYRKIRITFDQFTALVGESKAGKKTIFRALDIFFNGENAKRPITGRDLNENAEKRNDYIISIECQFENFTIRKSYNAKKKSAEELYFKENFDSQLVKVTNKNRGQFKVLQQKLPTFLLLDDEVKASDLLWAALKSSAGDDGEQDRIKQALKYLDDKVGRIFSATLATYRDLRPDSESLRMRLNNNFDITKSYSLDVSHKSKIEDLALAFLIAQGENANLNNIIYAFEEGEKLHYSDEDNEQLIVSIEKLASKNKQVIVIPHSASLVGLMPLESTRMIKNIAGDQEVQDDNLVEDVQTLGVKGNSEATRSQAVLLVEGKEDVKFVRKINQWMVEDGIVKQTLEEKGLLILPMGGCGNLYTWINLDLFRRLDIPWLILVDSDSGTPSYSSTQRHLYQIQRQYPESRGRLHATRKREIENYLVYKNGKQIVKFTDQEDVKEYMFNLMTVMGKTWSRKKTASLLMQNMTLKDLQDTYKGKDGIKHRELVEFFLEIDRFLERK